MGLLIESLAGIPFERGRFKVYVFVIGDTLWRGGILEIIHRNVDQLAGAIGRNALLVRGFPRNYASRDSRFPKDRPMHFGDEVCRHYLGKTYKDLSEHLPALLITDAHPKEMNDDTMRLLVPLEKMKRKDFKTVDRFFELLAGFTRGESDDFLKVLIAADGSLKKVGGYIDIDKLRIPFTPIAINVDKFLDKAASWLEKVQTKTESRKEMVKTIRKRQKL
ncbi:MAG: hypothetical protein Q8P51_10935 [Ignavibacteria bacterium]|nr:hypothetical protein [Ignavibacteria bacterium]